jgi:hypothetical protein
MVIPHFEHLLFLHIIYLIIRLDHIPFTGNFNLFRYIHIPKLRILEFQIGWEVYEGRESQSDCTVYGIVQSA